MPALVAGHSLGEYSALVAAGAFVFKDAVPLVRFRAQAMQEAVPVGQGGMAAVLGLSDDDVRAACAEAAQGEGRGAGQFQRADTDRHRRPQGGGRARLRSRQGAGAKRAHDAAGIGAIPFFAAAPGFADRLRDYMAGLQFAAPPSRLINNVDVAIVTDPAAIKDALVRQAASPVRWVETMQKFAAEGVSHVIECGPGKVLAGLTKRIDPAPGRRRHRRPGIAGTASWRS